MIIVLWISLLFLSLVICILGYYTDEAPYLTVGLFFLFLLGIAIVTGQLQYTTGATIDMTNTTRTIVTDNYTNWNDTTSHTVGYLLSAIGGIGFALSIRTQRAKKKAEGMKE